MGRPIVIVGFAMVAMLGLSGCTAAEPEPVSDNRIVEPVVEVAPSMPTGEIGRSKLVSPDGSVEGFVVLGYDDGFYAELVDYSASKGQFSLAFTDDRLAPGDCVYEKYQIAFDLTSDWPDGRMPLDGFAGDPSYFDSAVVYHYPLDPPVEGECWEKGAGYADLEWNIPDLRPGLEAKDVGPMQGALGGFTLTDDGEPLTYITESGDVLSIIATRFGLTIDDIAYLNPNRLLVYDANTAYTGEILNLSKEHRGDRIDP